MDLTSVTKTNPFAKLKCDSCNNCLSVFPIYITEDKKNICGRCPEELLEKFIRNEVYEALAEFIKFPCRYQDEGCGTKAVPEDVASHEKMCDFRAVKCPMKDCNWEGARTTLLLHCQGRHSNLILQNGEFELDMNQSYQRENFMEHDSALFIVRQKFYSINKLMEFSISNLETGVTIKEIPCEINFKTANRGLAVKYCIKASDDNTEELNLDALKDRNNSVSVVKGKINFENESTENAQPGAEKVDRELLSYFRCVKCTKYCLPPIYIQENDNTIWCNVCKSADLYQSNVGTSFCNHTSVAISTFGSAKSNQSFSFTSRNSSKHSSPSFSQPVFGTERAHLNKIALSQNYPCEYEKSGCTFISKPHQMTTHLDHCLYRNRSCPLVETAGCLWMGTAKDMSAHVFESHDSMILKSSTIPIQCPRIDGTASNFSKCYILKQLNHLFRLTILCDKQCYLWQTQMIGPFEKGFMFELEIMDRNNLGRSLMSKHPCTSLSDNNGVRLYSDQITPLIASDQMISFKVQIYKL